MAGKNWLVRFVCFTIGVSLWGVPAQHVMGAEHHDETGYSLTTPADWTVITKINQKSLPPAVNAWLNKNRLDLNRINAVLLRPGTGDFLENMNIVVEQHPLPMNSATIRKLLTEIPDQYQKLGVKLQDFRVATKKYGEHDTIVLEYQATMPLLNQPVAQRQVFFSSGGKTYIVTCTALPNTLSQYNDTFEQVLQSMKVDAPVTAGLSKISFDLHEHRTTVFSAIAVGVVIGVVGMLKTIFRG